MDVVIWTMIGLFTGIGVLTYLHLYFVYNEEKDKIPDLVLLILSVLAGPIGVGIIILSLLGNYLIKIPPYLANKIEVYKQKKEKQQ